MFVKKKGKDMPPIIISAAVGGILALILRPHVINIARMRLIKKSWDLHLPAKQLEMEALWDKHLMHGFSSIKDVAETLSTMSDNPYVNHVPTLIGGGGVVDGKEELQYCYANHFHFTNVPINTTLISRTIGHNQIVDEMVVSLNHTDVIDWLAPGVAPTGHRIEFPTVAVVGFEEDIKGDLKIARENIYWDQATVLLQMGVLSSSSVCKIDINTLDITGVEQAKKVLDPASTPSNELLRRKGAWLFKRSPKLDRPNLTETADDKSERIMEKNEGE